MQEIGGYIELDTYHLPMLHDRAISLNCGRNALAWLLRSRKIKRLWIPKLICDSITDVCKRERVPYSFYRIGFDFLPAENISLGDDEWLYFVNYYSQFDNDIILRFVSQYKDCDSNQTVGNVIGKSGTTAQVVGAVVYTFSHDTDKQKAADEILSRLRITDAEGNSIAWITLGD